MDNPILRRRRRDGAVSMAKLNRVRNDLALGVHFDEFEAPVRIEGGPDIETFFGSIIPGAAGGGFGMDEHPTPNWPQGSFVEVERTVEEFPSRDLIVDGRLTKKVEREFSLWQEQVPKIWRK